MKTHAKRSNCPSTTPFAKLARRLDAWRATRQPGYPMPEELWRAAAQLARLHGLNRTASALKLAYYALQRRLDEPPPKPTLADPPPARPTFVELPTPLVGKPLSQSSTLELSRSDGARFSVDLPSLPASELALLLKAFLRS